MIDRREAILAQLYSVLNAIDVGWHVYRNKEDLSEQAIPAVVLFDAHEDRDSIGESVTIRTNGISRVKMTPRIGLYVSDYAETVGTDLNTMRLAVLKAIFTDATLSNLITPSGAIFYEGCGSALDRGAEMSGEMLLSVAFYYPLLPKDWI